MNIKMKITQHIVVETSSTITYYNQAYQSTI